MAHRKIPQDAFSFYIGLGPARSYQAVAERYGVTKRAVVNLAVRERWQEQVEDLERKARQATNEKARESMEEMNLRHLKMFKIVQTKALEKLKQYPLETAVAAARALDSAIRQERRIRGEPAESGSTVEEIIKREYERWMTTAGDDDDLDPRLGDADSGLGGTP